MFTESLTSCPELENSQGQECHFGHIRAMSVVPPIADIKTSAIEAGQSKTISVGEYFLRNPGAGVPFMDATMNQYEKDIGEPINAVALANCSLPDFAEIRH